MKVLELVVRERLYTCDKYAKINLVMKPGKTSINSEDKARISEIPDIPFRSFHDLQQALDRGEWSLGVDSFAASYWASVNNRWWKRTLVKAFSLTLVAVAMLVIIGSIDLKEYWVLLAVPAMAIAFYIAEPSLPGRQYFTAIGIGVFVLFVGALVQGYPRLGIVFGLSALSFGLVRAASLINVTSFRKAVTTSENTFVAMYVQGGVTLRDNKNGKVFLNDKRR